MTGFKFWHNRKREAKTPPFFYRRFRHLTYGVVRLRDEERRFLLKICAPAAWVGTVVPLLGGFKFWHNRKREAKTPPFFYRRFHHRLAYGDVRLRDEERRFLLKICASSALEITRKM